MDSRGSLLMRRVGNRSMPTCGRDMATGWTPGIGATLILIGSNVETSIPELGWCPAPRGGV